MSLTTKSSVFAFFVLALAFSSVAMAAAPPSKVVEFKAMQSPDGKVVSSVIRVGESAQVRFTLPGGAGYATVLLSVTQGANTDVSVDGLTSETLLKLSDSEGAQVEGLSVSSVQLEQADKTVNMVGGPSLLTSTLIPTIAGEYTVIYGIGRLWQPTSVKPYVVQLTVE